MTSLQTAIWCASSADNKKGEDIVVLDLRKISTVTDFFVIVTGNSEPHLKALRNEVEAKLKEKGVYPRGMDGLSSSQWIVMDYHDVLIHILSRERRNFYAIERLWGDAQRVEWHAKEKTREE